MDKMCSCAYGQDDSMDNAVSLSIGMCVCGKGNEGPQQRGLKECNGLTVFGAGDCTVWHVTALGQGKVSMKQRGEAFVTKANKKIKFPSRHTFIQ
jgi:hypothetical protein